ncbi:MAG: DNA oxidative demethylase AlkB [Burkholderiaceae bacterium]
MTRAPTQSSLSFDPAGPGLAVLGDGIVLLPGFACGLADALFAGIDRVSTSAPFRRMRVPGGHTMSVAMTNCGQFGWVADETGYRYSELDPQSGRAWPPMPTVFTSLAIRAAAAAGFAGFAPDACLINRYQAGARLSLHRDNDEHDFDQPIVSVSLGSPARFVIGGLRRQDPTSAILLGHGDVLIWGGPARRIHHAAGAPRRRAGQTTLRLNLTFRFAGRKRL